MCATAGPSSTRRASTAATESSRSAWGNAGDGPWFYEGIQDWLSEQDTEPGWIYTFEGCYRLRAGGVHEFVGETTERPLSAS